MDRQPQRRGEEGVCGNCRKEKGKMKRHWRALWAAILSAMLLLTGCSVSVETYDEPVVSSATEEVEQNTQSSIHEDGTYTSKEEVAGYLYTFGHLPDNFITKKEARALGWESSEGNLAEVAPGMSIGGDYFGNYEGILPEAEGREYHECDIDSDGGYRGAKRIVYSNDGLIYYTEDHYETFELLYGEE